MCTTAIRSLQRFTRARREVSGTSCGWLPVTVDAVATDHAPHAPEMKDLPFDEAPPGMLGLEHAAALTYEAAGRGIGEPPDVLSLLQSRSRRAFAPASAP